MRLKTCILGVAISLFSFSGIGYHVAAQQTSFRVLSQSQRGITYEVTADWRRSLRSAADSSRTTQFSSSTVHVLTDSELEVSRMVQLPSLAFPEVRVVAADFDELTLPVLPAFADEATLLRTPAAMATELGWYRKEPVSSLAIRLLTYDPETGTVRRYRRVVVEVTYATAPGKRIASAEAANGHLMVDQSALADGTVIKIPIRREGVYRIDRTFLTSVGLNPDSIEPDRLQILGNGGAPLPALNGDERPVDLVQNPVFVRGGGDGSFGESDALFFYADDTAGWSYDTEAAQWNHYVNPFSTVNYYFLKVANEESLRLDAPAFPGFADATNFTSVTGRLYVDFDQFNWSKQNGSGLTWVSRTIDPIGRLDILQDSIPPGFSGGEVQFKARVAIKSNPAAFAYFNVGDTQIAQARAGSVLPRQEEPSARLTDADFVHDFGSGTVLDLSMTLQQQSNSPEAALDWIRAFYDQALTPRNGYLRFSTPANASGRMAFTLSGFNGEPQVWDVSDPGNISRLGVQAAGGNFIVQVEITPDSQPRELVAFQESAAVIPDASIATEVAPQNLHGIQSFPDFVIVTPDIFRPQAEELAAMRRDEGLDVVVISIDQIYNEFSGGKVDMRAVRDYLRFIYDRAPSDAERLRYALFFGDGHYDYRNLGSEGGDFVNWIPPYETDESFVPDRTYTSDDYFGLLDPDEGIWEYKGYLVPAPTGILRDSVDRVDIGIGRLTVQTEEEAQAILEKIKHYESPENYGSWRSRYTFIADDGPTGLSGTDNDEDLHLQNADVVAELVKDQYPHINIKKIYASSFDRVFRNGFKVPGARDEIIKSLEEGSLMVNYSGHGGEEGLAQEGIFTAEDAKALTNFDRLAIFVTATCSFGWWDLASYQSGAEELLLNPNGGAVALMTTVRLVYTSSVINTLNVGLNRQLARDMFEVEANGQPRRLGDVLRLTKNTRVGLQGNNRKFNLLGDPTMRVGLPGRSVAVETINGVALDQQPGQMQALDRVSVAGSIRTFDGSVDNTFNGVADVTVFDAERRIPIEDQKNMVTPYYVVREDLIWRGQVQVQQGRYNATFVVPKDISYSNQAGRLSVYAHTPGTHALGFNEDFLVGGTSANPPNDTQGPEITLFLNDTTFVSGGLTPPEPKLIVKLFDESGINTVGAGVGHEMLLIVNGDEQNAIDISSGFRSEANSFQRGIVEWELPEQKLGANSLSLRAWDVLNNSQSSSVDFFVAEDEDLVLRNVYNYPNPMSSDTRFVFEHNQAVGSNAGIQIRIYTLSGRLIRAIETDELLPGGPMQIAWDGRDEDGDRLATGIYLYKVRVEVESLEGDRQVSEHIEKLAVIR